jgi:hypothetical protein
MTLANVRTNQDIQDNPNTDYDTSSAWYQTIATHVRKPKSRQKKYITTKKHPSSTNRASFYEMRRIHIDKEK